MTSSKNGADDRHDVKIKDEANDKIVTAMNRTDGLFHIAAKTVYLRWAAGREQEVLLTYPATDRQEFSRRAQLRDW